MVVVAVAASDVDHDHDLQNPLHSLKEDNAATQDDFLVGRHSTACIHNNNILI